MVRAGICHGGRIQLKIVLETLMSVKYRDDILDPILLPFLQQGSFNQAFIQRLVGSMRWRCEAAVAAGGGHTRY